MEEFKKNRNDLKVLTPAGYQKFDGVAYMGDRPIYRLEFENGKWIECTGDHEIYVSDDQKVEASKIKTGDTVLTMDGRNVVVTNAFYTGRIEPVYDLIGVENGNRFYGNNILVSNCEFIAFDETLIDSIYLKEMDSGIDPLRKQGQVRWYDTIHDEHTYIVALDPSLGTGGDAAAIEVFSLPGMKQIGEWQHNKTPIQSQIKIMKSILEEIEEKAPNSEIYYSVENNAIGEAALVTIEEMGEENIPGIFLSEPRKKGNRKKYRRGFTTTHSSKLTACAKLKRLIEEGTMKIRSKNLVRELKTFVARGNSYAAKEGETDDLVMATVLAIRMAMQIAKYNEEVFKDLKDSFDDQDLRMPMPIGFLF